MFGNEAQDQRCREDRARKWAVCYFFEDDAHGLERLQFGAPLTCAPSRNEFRRGYFRER